ncbi:MAG: type II secretion system protein [Candidatus Gastranaerophilaceae bacterium]
MAEGATHVALLDNGRKFAFTLAEVLITLGIIGVVAAMTLPSLISEKHNRENQAALKKYYSVLQQVCMQMYIDEGQTINRLNYDRATFMKLFKKYFISVNKVNSSSVEYVEDEETGTLVYLVKEYKTFNKKTLHGSFFDDGTINIADSVMIFLERPVGGERMFISVDVNGVKKKPNLFGHDLFTFQVMDDGKVLPMGADGTMFTDHNTYCSKTSSNGSNGVSCTYKALTDKSYWKNL